MAETWQWLVPILVLFGSPLYLIWSSTDVLKNIDSDLLDTVLLLVYIAKAFKIVKEYERAGMFYFVLTVKFVKLIWKNNQVIFRLGSMRGEGASGPGVFFVIPCIDQYRVFDLRTKVAQIPVGDVLTSDSLTLVVDAAMFYRIVDPAKTASNVEDYAESTTLLGATTLRNRLGLSTLTQILFETHVSGFMSELEAKFQLQLDDDKEVMEQLNETTSEWGIVVDRIEIQR